MDVFKPLFWHQGLFLQPQHFQLADLYAQGLLEPYFRFILPYFWGVARLDISPGALGNNSLEVREGEFLFPDGTYTLFPGNAQLESRSFASAWSDRSKPLTVFLGIRKWNRAGANVTVVPSLDNLAEIPTRYVTTAMPDEAIDLHQTGQPGEVQLLHYNLKIFWESETERMGDYQMIPVARLSQDGEKIKFSGDFIPPALTMQGAASLLNALREVRDQVASRCRSLEEYKVQRGIHSAEFGSRDMIYLLALRSLNRYVPLLSHYAESPTIHPWQVFGLLRQLIGELSSFSSGINVHGEEMAGEALLKSYDHLDLGPCFISARDLITRLLDEITAGPEYIIQLQYDGTYYAAELAPAIFEGRNRFYLVVETETESKTVIEALQGIAKLSSREVLPLLIARALPGVSVVHLPVPPQELPRRAHCLYFQLNQHGDQWGKVEESRNMALYWNAAPDDFKAELMVIGRS